MVVGTNDAGFGVTEKAFISSMKSFINRLEETFALEHLVIIVWEQPSLTYHINFSLNPVTLRRSQPLSQHHTHLRTHSQ